MQMICNETGFKFHLNFKPYSKTHKEHHKVEGFIFDDKCVELILPE